MTFPKTKLRYRLMLLLIGITAVSFVLAISQILIKIQNVQEKNALSQEQQIADITTKQITEFINLQFVKLATIGDVFTVLTISPDVQNNLLEQVLFSSDTFQDISLTNSQGREIARVSRTEATGPKDLVDQSKSEKFLRIKNSGLFISKIFWERNRQFFTIGMSVFSPQGNPRGAVFATVDAKSIQRVITDLSTGEQIRAYIVDTKGIVVAHPDISMVLAQKDFSYIPIVKSLLAGRFLNSVSDVYKNELGQEAIGRGSPISLSFGDNEPKRLLNTDWFVVIEIPTFIALASVREVTIFSIYVLLFVLLLAAVAAAFFTQRLISPIQKLNLVVKEVEKGNFSVRSDIKTKDEIEEFAATFNNMLDQLQTYNAALEEAKTVLEIRVQARTRELTELTGSLETKVIERTSELKARLEELERLQELTVGRELKMIELKKEIEEMSKKIKKNYGSRKKET